MAWEKQRLRMGEHSASRDLLLRIAIMSPLLHRQAKREAQVANHHRPRIDPQAAKRNHPTIACIKAKIRDLLMPWTQMHAQNCLTAPPQAAMLLMRHWCHLQRHHSRSRFPLPKHERTSCHRVGWAHVHHSLFVHIHVHCTCAWFRGSFTLICAWSSVNGLLFCIFPRRLPSFCQYAYATMPKWNHSRDHYRGILSNAKCYFHKFLSSADKCRAYGSIHTIRRIHTTVPIIALKRKYRYRSIFKRASYNNANE